ncbi:exportin-T-like [Impatiens glandulifera]|uniref:exportin-T-like n=1 Tax=Impatiens glandulifera TaxID=253017 RepID=UPI001FB11122|nr:exportin-T-like [Impatiens glandulifera]XP_047342581.1 exportin-T-like [Impatiens glandulifera]XP_047342582.1 exportin-T-like [Impatiens glandulifera]
MDDLEKAIVITFDGLTDSALNSQAVSYCQQVKDNPSISYICIDHLCSSKLAQVQFWCLQCLHETVQVRYSSMSPHEQAFVRKSVFSMACFDSIDGKTDSARILEGPAFVKNKLAQVFVKLIYLEYPEIWPSVFIDYLPHLNKGVTVIDMFCRILNSLDEELISLDYHRNSDELAVATRVKDAMRQQCVPQIVKACYDIISMCRNYEPFLCANVMDSIKRHVSWIDIGLIANDPFITLFFDLISNDDLPIQLRGSATGCVLAAVSKRMEYLAKLKLLQTLQIKRVSSLVMERRLDDELFAKIAILLTGYANEALVCSMRLRNSVESNRSCIELLNEVFPSIFHVMLTCEIDIMFIIVQFLSDYFGMMKLLLKPSEEQLFHANRILEIISLRIRYDPIHRKNVDVFNVLGKEEEDRMTEFRKDLFVLLRGVGRVLPDITQIFIKNSLVRAFSSSSGSDSNVEEVEAALSLFYAYGESDTMKENGILRDLVPTLLSTRLHCHSNRIVALVYLEMIYRYMKLPIIKDHNEYIPIILSAFLDERGVHHSNVHVSRRAAYLFTRVVKQLKAKFVPFIDTILQSLGDTLTRFTSDQLGNEDGSDIFEAIGLLIGVQGVSPEKQVAYLSSLLTPLCQQVDAKLQDPEESPAKIVIFQQIVLAINALSKGFSVRVVTSNRPTIGLMFRQTLEVLLRVLAVYPKIEILRIKITSFIHQMVETLGGASVFPYLPKALEQLLVESEPKEMTRVLLLLNQLICKSNTELQNILEDIYPVIASMFLNLVPIEAVSSEPKCNTEEIRERQELQKLFYTFLNAIAMNDMSSVFLSQKSRVCLDSVMQNLLETSCKHKDIVVRKLCVQIFIRLIKDWCVGPFGEDKLPGFQGFVVEIFATNCCLYSVLDKSFEFTDSNTMLLFKEIALVQKVMYEKFDNEFLLHFVSKWFPSAQCPQDLAEQYCKKLKHKDLDVLVSFYQNLIENLRHQIQNLSTIKF